MMYTQLLLAFSPSSPTPAFQQLESAIASVSSCMTSNLLALNPSKPEFLLNGLPRQLAKINDLTLVLSPNITITSVPSARNLGFHFDSSLTLDPHLSQLSRTCYAHIRDLRRLRPFLDLRTASTIATVVHSKLDYCNFLYYNLPKYQLRLQAIQNALARAVTNTPNFAHISPVLQSLHWLKITERIKYKIISITYNVLQTSRPGYLFNFSIPNHKVTCPHAHPRL